MQKSQTVFFVLFLAIGHFVNKLCSNSSTLSCLCDPINSTTLPLSHNKFLKTIVIKTGTLLMNLSLHSDSCANRGLIANCWARTTFFYVSHNLISNSWRLDLICHESMGSADGFWRARFWYNLPPTLNMSNVCVCCTQCAFASDTWKCW